MVYSFFFLFSPLISIINYIKKMNFITSIISGWLNMILYFCLAIKSIIDIPAKRQTVKEDTMTTVQQQQPLRRLRPLRTKDCRCWKTKSSSVAVRRPSPMEQLPTEILLNIFHRLNLNDLYHCSTVSMRWFEVSSYLLWKSPVPKLPIFECLPALLDIDKKHNIRHYHQPSSRISAAFPLHLDRVGHLVRSLDLSHIASYITDCTIRHIVNSCPYLTSLNLTNCRFITNNSLQHIGQSPLATDLKELVLQGCQQIDDVGLNYLEHRCQSLETLAVGHCPRITDKGVISLVTASGQTIRRLRLNDSRHVTVSSLHAIARLCGSRLELLDMTRIKNVRYEDIADLVEHCPNITSLHVSLKRLVLMRGGGLRAQVNEIRQQIFRSPSPHPLIIVEEDSSEQQQQQQQQQSENYSDDDALVELLDMLTQFNVQLNLSQNSSRYSQALLERQRRRDAASIKSIQAITFGLRNLEYLNISYC
ncbi:MAG: hypothetical protein EXX96DRAFT_574367 [Benjaminiella poitrasii]|nr:MAG: hypothetical protein EXX96DRAFT_574367 [Benjaminiella poitrasii]